MHYTTGTTGCGPYKPCVHHWHSDVNDDVCCHCGKRRSNVERWKYPVYQEPDWLKYKVWNNSGTAIPKDGIVYCSAQQSTGGEIV